MSFWRTVTHRKKREQAIEMFCKNCHPTDIAHSLGVSLRSVQRWINEFKNNDGVNIPSVNSSIPEDSQQENQLDVIQIMINNSRRLCEDTHEIGGYLRESKKYIEFLERISHNHLLTHYSIRQKLEQLLESELIKSNPNLRSIHQLSLGVSRHIVGEREACGLWHLLDLGRAIDIVIKEGYEVHSPVEKENEEDYN